MYFSKKKMYEIFKLRQLQYVVL